MAQTNTGRSVSKATTPIEVYNALVAQAITKGAIVKLDAYASGVKVTQRSEGFMRSNGNMSYPCRTNKFMPSIKEAVIAFGKKLPADVERAKELAYELRDKHCVNVTIWGDNKDLNAFLGGRPFTGQVILDEYADKQGEQQIRHTFTDCVLDAIVSETSSLSMDDFAFTVDEPKAPGKAGAGKKKIQTEI